MLINVTGCTMDDALEALSLLDGVLAEEVVESTEPRMLDAWLKLPSTGSQRQATLLHFIKEGKSTRDRCKLALGLGSHSDCATRVTELMRGGFLSETGERWETLAGEMAAVLAPTEKARRDVKLAPRKWFPMGVRIGVSAP